MTRSRVSQAGAGVSKRIQQLPEMPAEERLPPLLALRTGEYKGFTGFRDDWILVLDDALRALSP